MTTYAGIDAGGTKTAVLLARDDKLLSRATGAPGAVRPGRALQAASRISSAVRKALSEAGLLQVDILVVGAAGVGREPERGELRESLRGERVAERVIVTGDLDIALEAAFGSGPGMVVISGTGSVVVGRTPDGILHRRGGYGWQMGDEGSGYAIARAALVAVGRGHDGRGKPTALRDAILAAGPARTFEDLVRWSTTVEPGEVAGLAQVVFQCAEAGDAVAAEIVAGGADELAGLVDSMLSLFGKLKPVPVALVGGNLSAGRALRAPVVARLGKLARVEVHDRELDPAEGALAIARRS